MVFSVESFISLFGSKILLCNCSKIISLFEIHFVNLKPLFDNDCSNCVALLMRSLTHSLNLLFQVNIFIHFVLEKNLKGKVSSFYQRFGHLFDTFGLLNLECLSKELQLTLFHKKLEKHLFNTGRYRLFSFLKF